MSAPLPVTFTLEPDGIGWLVFDDPAGRANVFNAGTQAAFARIMDEIAIKPMKALVISSAKAGIFVAGADLDWLARLSDAEAAANFSRVGQRLFTRLEQEKVPVVCAINGACAGGGYELALGCHWRIATNAPATRIGLPETGLGLIPGWGGCVRLPRLIGAEAAIDHILKGQLIPADEALRCGLIDELVGVDELWTCARAVALKLAASGRPNRQSRSMPENDFFVARRKSVMAKNRGEQPALLAVIDVVEQTSGQPIDVALEIEAKAFGQVTAGEVCKNMLHAFAVREAARKRSLVGWFPATNLKPEPISRVGVVGAGVMGSGIAQLIALRGMTVVLRDIDETLLRRGLETIRALSADAIERNKIARTVADAAFNRITTTTAWDGFAECDLVIEAIVENADAKRKLFSELASMVRPNTILASNTSALPIEELAGRVLNTSRTLGIHFFNPVSRMPLVELIIGRDTSAEAAERALRFVTSLGKMPVICRSSPGFLVTRVLFFYLNEAVHRWEDGESTEAIDRALRRFGWPMGPLRLIDEVGLDVTQAIFREMAHYFSDRFSPSKTCARLVAAGLKGRKNGAGAGFYRYDGDRARLNDDATRAVTATRVTSDSNGDELVRQLIGTMIGEAERCIQEGVVRSPDDVDFALLSGAGFPVFRGGLLRYAHGRKFNQNVAGPNSDRSALVHSVTAGAKL